MRFARAFAELEDAAFDRWAVSVEVIVRSTGSCSRPRRCRSATGFALVRAGALDRRAAATCRAGRPRSPCCARGRAGESGAEAAGRRLRRLQTALRLWDDAEPPRPDRVGAHGWRRRLVVPLATGLRRAAGRLSARRRGGGFAARVLRARRSPHAARRELAWALGRFELGCERAAPSRRSPTGCGRRAHCSPSPTGGHEGVAERLAAICAAPEERDARRAPSATRSRSSAPWSPDSGARAGGRGARHRARRGTCGRSCATCSAAISIPICAASPTRCSPSRPAGGPARLGCRRRRGAEQVLAHVREPLEVVDVVGELRDHDRRRVAEPRAGGRRCGVARASAATRPRPRHAARRVGAELLGELDPAAPAPAGAVRTRLTTSPPNGSPPRAARGGSRSPPRPGRARGGDDRKVVPGSASSALTRRRARRCRRSCRRARGRTPRGPRAGRRP